VYTPLKEILGQKNYQK